jgi:UDP-GlcNAc3NAcA epimerase
MAKKIITIVGARPQFIKAAAVSRIIAQTDIEEKIVHTGQHFDSNMSHVFFEEMEIPRPHYNLDIHSLTHGAMTGRMIEKIEKILIDEKPDYLMVYGDTNSTLAGALAAQKLHIPIAHVEAGLRSFNMQMPEETNRILTDRISSLLFCPTDNAINNLKNEGFENIDCQLIRSGDVMQDAALYYEKKSNDKSQIIKNLKLNNTPFLLSTIHRQENTDDPVCLQNIVAALNELAKQFRIVLPLHPRTRKILLNQKTQLNFEPIDPIGYFDMIQLIKNSQFVITDSGGLQKEAFFFKKYCITTRTETEWVELVKFGFNTIVGANKIKILQAVNSIGTKNADFSIDLYGKGKASEQIVRHLLEFNL